ncbi:hypothetical protein FQN60_015470 [Etheostoma spectabile]|uniref:CCAAT-binding factor domain-containing protein n=1 Tax=Etheostoma spectabile TaxID=54343 RepID=A0A5J5CMX7_9PERO|nr:hypothetical protein FQN60_015470 [Etheostoma spectabile]
MKTVVSSGVLADRMAAMTVLIQDAPVHTLEHVESLVSMVKRKGSRRMGLMALDTLRELLLSDLLPEHRKLRAFAEHPFDQLEEKASGNRDARDRRLILWYYEHHLKHHVAEFAAALDTVAHDTVAATKAKALATAYELLCNRPEQERALLIQVVNKLGDPEYKTAAKASYLLESLLRKHPNMKAVVCCEVERIMFRPNISAKAQYYAVCFLSQVMLSHDEAELAAKLITIYFSFFRACVKKKDVESKMLSALLSGVNRAYPYAGAGDEKSMFLNLLYKSLKADIVLRRVKAFVKRLLQVSSEQNASFACGALFLVSEEGEEEEEFKDLAEEKDDDDDDEEERFTDADKLEEGASVETEKAKPTASWVHHQNLEGGKSVHSYDPLHRNPLFCGADHSTLWELQRLAVHYHPSVSLFATTILQGGSIQYSGDPLQDFTLIRFLDRFPKHSSLVSIPVNCEEFLSKEESQVAVDEIFFHRFFRKRQQEKQLKARRPRGDGDNDSVEDVDDEDNVKSKKGKKDTEDSDSDDSDLDDLDDEEVSLGSMDEEDFGDELDEDGGTFVDPEGVPELEDAAFGDSDDEMDVPDITPRTKQGKRKRKSSEEAIFSGSSGPKQGKKKKGKKDAVMFVSADEFGSLLDENAGSKFDNIGLNAMANTDKAGLKQLKWESQRNDWIQGRDVKTLRRKKTMFNKKKTFGRARTGGKTLGQKKRKK